MQTPSKELFPFGSAAPVGCATGRLPTAPGARPAARRQGKAIDDEHVARGDAPPTFAGIQVIPIGELMEATIDARDADSVASKAAPVRDLHGLLVMVAKILGGDDGYRHNLRIGDVRPHITAMSQAFRQGVNHDKSGYYRASDRRLLLAAMFGLTTAIVPEMSVDVN